jgi:hypothetical protein
MVLVLKIPIVYVCFVIYWAVKKTPQQPEPARLPAADGEFPPQGTRRGPHRCQDRPRPRRPSSSRRVPARPRPLVPARR